MIGKIFITRTGYDPQLGKHVKDRFLRAAGPAVLSRSASAGTAVRGTGA